MNAHETFKYQQLLAKCCSETEVNMKHEHSRLGMTATAASEVVTCEAKSFAVTRCAASEVELVRPKPVLG